MIKLLIFDLDGTLSDTSIDIKNAINYALEPFGVSPLSVENIKSMVGSGITKLVESLVQPDNINNNRNPEETVRARLEQALARFLEHYSEHLLDNTTAYPGVRETLLKLGNYKKVVVSNKLQDLSKKVLEGLDISEFFEAILGSDSFPEKKPSPLPILEVLRRLNMQREHAVIIGDSNFDVEAGKRAGIKTIAVTYGYRNRGALKDADFMIDSFEELLRVLKEID
ncbi:MAG: HAD-IA family hydrolase [Candidatus Mariimomonas ferrooxydans]